MILKEITEEHIKSTDPLTLIKSLGYYTKIDRDFLNLFMERMVDNKHIKPKYKFTDEIELDKEQMNIFKISKTKIGRLIFNSFCLPQAYIETFGFVNEQVDSSVYDTIHNNLATLLLGKKITHEEYADVINRLSWLGMTMTNFKGHSMDFDSITMSDKFLDHKNKVYKELIDKNASPEEVLKAEDDLLNIAKEEKKDTGLYKIIKSGSKGNFSNNFKNLNIGRGLIQMPDGKPKVLTNSLAEGNKLSDYIYLSNNSIQGSFGRSLKTAQGGYLSKLVSTGFAHLKVTDTVDCGTTHHLKVKITKENYKDFFYRFIKSPSAKSYIELNQDNYKQFIGYEVLVRSPMFCHDKDGMCRTCYGNLVNMNKITSGLNVLIADLSSTIMNKAMKSFHDLTAKYNSINIKKEIENKNKK